MWDGKYVKIGTNCKQAKKEEKNTCFQNIQTNACKNEAGKPLFLRVPGGYCVNEESPFRALRQIKCCVQFCDHTVSRNCRVSVQGGPIQFLIDNPAGAIL